MFLWLNTTIFIPSSSGSPFQVRYKNGTKDLNLIFITLHLRLCSLLPQKDKSADDKSVDGPDDIFCREMSLLMSLLKPHLLCLLFSSFLSDSFLTNIYDYPLVSIFSHVDHSYEALLFVWVWVVIKLELWLSGKKFSNFSQKLCFQQIWRWNLAECQLTFTDYD